MVRITMFIGKIHYKSPFSKAMLVIAKGYDPITSHEKPPFSYDFPMVFLLTLPVSAPAAQLAAQRPVRSLLTGADDGIVRDPRGV